MNAFFASRAREGMNQSSSRLFSGRSVTVVRNQLKFVERASSAPLGSLRDIEHL
jgi:hypothetical protein